MRDPSIAALPVTFTRSDCRIVPAPPTSGRNTFATIVEDASSERFPRTSSVPGTVASPPVSRRREPAIDRSPLIWPVPSKIDPFTAEAEPPRVMSTIVNEASSAIRSPRKLVASPLKSTSTFRSVSEVGAAPVITDRTSSVRRLVLSMVAAPSTLSGAPGPRSGSDSSVSVAPLRPMSRPPVPRPDAFWSTMVPSFRMVLPL